MGGLLTAWKIYGRLTSSDDPLAEKSLSLSFIKSKLFFDEIYSFYEKNSGPFLPFSRGDGILFVSGLMVRGSAGIAALFALLGKSFYSGKIHSYSFWFVIGTIGFLAYSIFGGNS